MKTTNQHNEDAYQDETIELAAELELPLQTTAMLEVFWFYQDAGPDFKGKARRLRGWLEERLGEKGYLLDINE